MGVVLSPEETGLPTQGDNVPVVRLRDYLIDAKRGHAQFDTAWQLGRIRAVRGLSASERSQWLKVLDETQNEWRACYQGRSSGMPQLVALQRLFQAK